MSRVGWTRSKVAFSTRASAETGPARDERSWPYWSEPLATPALGADDVHVWYADLNVACSELRRFEDTLSPDERRRTAHYPLPKHRVRFIVRRGILRELLGQYLGRMPDRVRLRYGAHGKPGIAGVPGDMALNFNLAHSRDVALYAFSLHRRVGVDIEHIRDDVECASIAEHFFSPAEAMALSRLPAVEQVGAFFSCWTRKEAYIKARGEGLSLPLSRFTVSVDPHRPAALLETSDEPAERLKWSVADLAVRPDCRAALIVEGQGWRLNCWRRCGATVAVCSSPRRGDRLIGGG